MFIIQWSEVFSNIERMYKRIMSAYARFVSSANVSNDTVNILHTTSLLIMKVEQKSNLVGCQK